MKIGLNYARIAVYKNLMDYMQTHKNLHHDKHHIFSIGIIDAIIQKTQDYIMEKEEIDVDVTDTIEDTDTKMVETIKRYFHIDDKHMIAKNKAPYIIETFLHLYRIKAATTSELMGYLYFTSTLNNLFKKNTAFVESCIDANEKYILKDIKELVFYYKEYLRLCRDSYNSRKNIWSVKQKLKEIAEKKNALLRVLCIDNRFYRSVVDQKTMSQRFDSEDFYLTKLKKEITEYRMLHESVFENPNDITTDDLVLYFNILISNHYYANMAELIESGVLDDFPREKNYIMTQVALEDAVCESIFLGFKKKLALNPDKKEKCGNCPKKVLYKLYKVPIDSKIREIMETTDDTYITDRYALASNICSILFLKSIASIDPTLEDKIYSLIRTSPKYNSDESKTSTRLIQNFMNLEYVCQSEIEKINQKKKGQN